MCKDCICFSYDKSTGQGDCIELDRMSEEETEKYFTNDEEGCKYKLKETDKKIERLKKEVAQFLEDKDIKDTMEIALKKVLKEMSEPYYESPCENCWGCMDEIKGEPNWKMFYCRYNR